MLFALDGNGTPSVAATIKIDSDLPDYRPGTLPLDPGFQVTINGDAAYDGFDDSYALVPQAASKHGSVMADEKIDLSHAFDLTFEINLGASNAGGDGVAFVLHNDASGAAALGAAGIGLGATGIGNGLAIRFTTSNPSDPVNDATDMIDTDSGTVIATSVGLGNIEDGAWHSVHVTWNGTTLAYAFDGIARGSVSADIAMTSLGGSQFAWFGFTGGSGTAPELDKVRIDRVEATLADGATVAVDRADLPKAPSFVTNGDAGYDAAHDEYVVAPDAADRHGSVMTAGRIDLSHSFVAAFEMRFGSQDDGGDGVAFVLHNDPLGNHALGGTAEGLGALGIADGLAITFDTSGSAGNVAGDHSGFVDTDDGTLAAPASDIGHLEDGRWHTVRVAWDADAHALSYSLDGVGIATLTGDIAATYLGGSAFAYLGITAATGDSSEPIETRLLRLDAKADDGSALHLVGPNTAPAAAGDSYTVAANGTLTVSAAAGVLANDTDADLDPLTICGDSHLLPHDRLLAPANGTLTMNADGSFLYTPRAGFVGVDHFSYCAEDFANACTSGEVTITVGAPDPLPAFVANGNAVAEAAPATYTLTPDAVNQRGSVMSATTLDLSQAFTLSFDLNLGDKDAAGADGAAFILHNDPRGSQTLGSGGSLFGAGSIAKGIVIQFDTYANPGFAEDIANDHTSFINPKTGLALSPIVDLGNIEDGNWHNVVVTWDGRALSYAFDGVVDGFLGASSVMASLAGSTQAYFGFSAATGGLSSHMEVHVLSLATSIIPMSVSVAEYLLAGAYPAAYAVTLADTAANLLTLTPAQFGALAGNHVDMIDASDDALSLTVAEWRTLADVALISDGHGHHRRYRRQSRIPDTARDRQPRRLGRRSDRCERRCRFTFGCRLSGPRLGRSRRRRSGDDSRHGRQSRRAHRAWRSRRVGDRPARCNRQRPFSHDRRLSRAGRRRVDGDRRREPCRWRFRSRRADGGRDRGACRGGRRQARRDRRCAQPVGRRLAGARHGRPDAIRRRHACRHRRQPFGADPCGDRSARRIGH